MRRRANEVLLRQVASIRALQCLAAEARAGRAAAELADRNAAHAESERRRSGVEEHWAASLAAPVIDICMLPILSVAFVTEEQAVHAAMGEVKRAQAELEDRATAFRTASMHRDNAKQMAHDARKTRMRQREEAAMQNASDRHAQRWSRG